MKDRERERRKEGGRKRGERSVKDRERKTDRGRERRVKDRDR